jgi:ABC-type uncharacterized transport system permease subunit
MVSTLLGGLAVAAYMAAALGLYRSLKPDYDSAAPARRFGPLGLGWIGAGLHAAAMAGFYSAESGPDFSFLSALSLVTFIVAAIVLVTALFKPVDKLGLVAFPLAAAILLLKLAVPEEARVLREYSWPLALHIVSSVTAYAFLNIAAIQAVLLAIQDWCLRHRHPDGLLVRSLPPMQTMESMLFQLIGAGLALLTVSLITGFLFMEDMFAQHLAHKTVLSIVAWIVFAVLLAGRVRSGWRGRTAIRWTLGGFISLMLAYFGSKMVLEWILHRT